MDVIILGSTIEVKFKGTVEESLKTLAGSFARLAAVAERLVRRRPRASIVRIKVYGGQTFEGEAKKLMAKIRQEADLTAQFTGDDGQPKEVPDAVWTSSDEAVATVSAVSTAAGKTPVGHATTVGLGDAVLKCTDPDADDDASTSGDQVDAVLMVNVRDRDTASGAIAEPNWVDSAGAPPA